MPITEVTQLTFDIIFSASIIGFSVGLLLAFFGKR